MQQFLRKSRLTFSGGGSLIVNPDDRSTTQEMKIGFNVSKGVGSSANTATIEIWNLNKTHRNMVGKELDSVTLECGYTPPTGGSNLGIIFKGNLRDVEHRRDGPDIITKVSCGDGDKAFRSATISKTYPEGTPVQTVMEDIYAELAKKGIKKGEWKFPDDMKDFKRPYSVCGGCQREANTLGRGRGFYWNVQNETMEVIPRDGYLGGGVPLISAETGMIDTPTITDNGVRVKALLNPAIRPNRLVEVESETLEMNAEGGLYRVSQCTFSGNNIDGNDFSVTIQGESIQGGKVDEGVQPT